MEVKINQPLFEPDALDDAARSYIQGRVKEGASRKAIVQELTQRGYNKTLAETMVDRASRGPVASVRRSGLLLLIAGIIITVISLGLTVGSYLSAVEQGGTYVVCCGLTLFGLYLTIRGITQLVKGREVK
jgi:hypothetical protein